jgi:hypothetical protein
MAIPARQAKQADSDALLYSFLWNFPSADSQVSVPQVRTESEHHLQNSKASLSFVAFSKVRLLRSWSMAWRMFLSQCRIIRCFKEANISKIDVIIWSSGRVASVLHPPKSVQMHISHLTEQQSIGW